MRKQLQVGSMSFSDRFGSSELIDLVGLAGYGRDGFPLTGSGVPNR